MKKLLLIFSILLYSIIKLNSQTPFISYPVNAGSASSNKSNLDFYCATDEMVKELYKKYPERKQKAHQIDDAIYKMLNNKTYTPGTRGAVYTIPVVVHIIHNNGPENISNIQVIQGIQDLNEAFSNTGSYIDANGVDVEIQFCLAQRDPNGNATNGITRNVSTLTNMTKETDDLALKNIDRWNPNDYLNIWLVNEITSQVTGPGIVGYAYFPSSHGNPEDGVVNESGLFGNSINGSKVHVHEIGHYLGLYHTFEGGCGNNNCLTDGDQVCDTPPDNSTAIVPCNGTINTCTTDDDDLSTNNPFRPIANGGIGDQNDLFQDHMDYGDLPCHTLFTNGQKDRMRAALTAARASLLMSQGCISPCTNPIVISFNASSTTVTLGTNVTFTNTSTGNITNYNWSINNTSFATTQNSNYTFNTTGNYWVVLTLNNSDPNCKKQDSLLIKVICSAQANFTASTLNVQPGASITFTSTSTGATSYQWFIDGTLQTNTQNFTHTFSTAGGFMVYLVACNAQCCDTSGIQLISVGTCRSKEGNIWYFGSKAGLDFNAGAPSQLSNSSMYQLEGCSTISDKNGQLLFYSDGQTVWNKNHQVMQNGTGLWGRYSTTQSALIVKKPGSSSLYYLFTIDWQAGTLATNPPVYPFPGCFAYSIIDISLNGGLGSVITKNQLIYTPSTEKQVAIKHANGTDVWIITHKWNSNEFAAHLLTCNGLEPIPVISSVGTIHPDPTIHPWPSYPNAIGQMTVSPNGKKLALAMRDAFLYELFDFNTCDGSITNPITFPIYTSSTWINDPHPYGVAFSPDNKKLYCATNKKIYQLDLSSGVASSIIASATTVAYTNNQFGSLQLAPDGKIYISYYGGSVLDAINIPNASGAACNYQNNAITFTNPTSSVQYGLQNLLVDYFAPKKAAKIQGNMPPCDTVAVVCNQNVTFYIKNNCGVDRDSIAWILNGSSTIVAQHGDSITIKSTQVGVDTLICIQYAACGVVTDTLLIQTNTGGPIINIGKDTTICSPNILQLNAGAGFSSYLWSNTATVQNINITTPGIYWVEVSDANGCKSRDTIKVVQGNTKPNVNLGPDKIVCPGKVIPMDAGSGYMNYNWFDNSNNQTNTALLPGTYWVTVKDSCGNISKDTIQIILGMSGAISIGADTILCNNETLALNAGNGYATYLWQDGSTNQTYTAINSGTYIVHVTTNDGCAYSDTIRVDDCTNTVQIQDCEIGIPDAFSPNGDGMNDELRVLGKCIDKLTFIVYDRWGEKVFETNNPNQGWDGTFRGKKMDNAVFAYYLKITTFKGSELSFKGNVSLIK